MVRNKYASRIILKNVESFILLTKFSGRQSNFVDIWNIFQSRKQRDRLVKVGIYVGWNLHIGTVYEYSIFLERILCVKSLIVMTKHDDRLVSRGAISRGAANIILLDDQIEVFYSRTRFLTGPKIYC